MREHLHVDAGLVHFLDPQGAEVVEPLFGLVATAGFRAGEMLGQLRVPVMLFDRNDRIHSVF